MIVIDNIKKFYVRDMFCSNVVVTNKAIALSTEIFEAEMKTKGFLGDWRVEN